MKRKTGVLTDYLFHPGGPGDGQDHREAVGVDVRGGEGVADMIDFPVYQPLPPILHQLIPEESEEPGLVLAPGVSGHERGGKDPASDLLSQPLEGEGVEVEVADVRQGLELRGQGVVPEEVGEMGGVVEEGGEVNLLGGAAGHPWGRRRLAGSGRERGGKMG